MRVRLWFFFLFDSYTKQHCLVRVWGTVRLKKTMAKYLRSIEISKWKKYLEQINHIHSIEALSGLWLPTAN